MVEVTDEKILRAYRRTANRLIKHGLIRAETIVGDINFVLAHMADKVMAETKKAEDTFLQVSIVVSRGSKRLLQTQPQSGGLLALAPVGDAAGVPADIGCRDP